MGYGLAPEKERSLEEWLAAEPSGARDKVHLSSRLRAIFETHARFVWRTLRYQWVPERDLPDASQEVFLVIFRKSHEFDVRRSVRAWIYGICVRVACDWRRRAHLRREVLVDDIPDDAPGLVDLGESDRISARSQLSWLLSKLDEEKRVVYVLYEIERFSMNEIAEILECPRKTAYSRLAAARKQMFETLLRLGKADK